MVQLRTLAFAFGAAAVSFFSSACGGGTTPHDSVDAGVSPDAAMLVFPPDVRCPGSESCSGEGDGVLRVGAATVDITPVIDATVDIQSVDVNDDGEYNPEQGDRFEDRNGNGTFDGIWIAGYGRGRAAKSVETPQSVRAVVLRWNDVTIALVTVDCVGLFYDDVLAAREALPTVLGIDYLGVSATHTHEARDTMGVWGPDIVTTGVDEAYMQTIREAILHATTNAVGALTPAHVTYAKTSLRNQPGGTLRIVGDLRDPFIVDDEVRIARFQAASDGHTIATLVNFGSHPEYSGQTSQSLSSDFPHFLRAAIEHGAPRPDGSMEPGLGGVALFMQGAVGVQIGPNHTMPSTWDGRALERETPETTRVVGEQLAYYVLHELASGTDTYTSETAALGVRSKAFMVDVQNAVYYFAILFDVFRERATYNWDPRYPIRAVQNEPDIRTEVAVIDVGDIQMLTVPGELDPALFLGGYDGSYTPPGVPIVDTTRTNPPDLSRAPGPPYLRDFARRDARQVWLLGLFTDEIGYFVPEFDYVLASEMPYVTEAPGSHYEETNSAGPGSWPRVHDALVELLREPAPAP